MIKKETKEMIIIYLIAIPIAILSVMSWDIFITFIFLFLSLAAIIISLKSKYYLMFRTLSIFIFLHFIVFPYIYVLIIKLDSKSFLIDNTIEQNEISNIENEIQRKYNPNELESNKVISLRLLSTNNPYLDSSFNSINNNNIVKVDSFMLHKTYTNLLTNSTVDAYATLAVCNSKGILLAKYIGERGYNISGKLTIREFLKDNLNKIEESKKELAVEKEKISKKDIWSYRRILAYSINIFDTDNIKPKTKISNIIFFMHKLIIVIFVLGVFATTLYEYLMDKKKI